MTDDEGAVRSGDRTVARRELMLSAARAASGLLAAGVRPGDAVALLMRNDIAFVEAIFAAGFLGAQAVPLNWHFTPDEIEYVLRDCGATRLVVHADLMRDLGDALPAGVEALYVRTPPEIRAAYGIDEAAAEPPGGAVEWESWVASHAPLSRHGTRAGGTMMYTSGTTGRPKGVRRDPPPPARRTQDAELRQRWFGNRPGMRTAILGPLYHSVQLSYTTAAVSAPGRVVLAPRFDAEDLLRLIDAERLTHVHLVPIMMNRLVRLPAAVRERYDLSSLEFVVHGSAPCAPQVKRALIEWLGPVVHEYYGTTEAGMVCRASSEEWLARPGTVGRPWPGRTVRIYDDDGAQLPPRTEGEVYMSLGAMPDFTYHNAAAERARIERDGLVTSGDVGYLDEDGYLYLCDRKRDMVISGGVNIYPAEVEGVLAEHPRVLDCAVFGIPDDDYGELPAAAVALHPGAQLSAEELIGFARRRLASFKVPRRIEFRDELPRDASGKIARRRLRDPHWETAGRRI